jgi:hypothetical protein
MGPECAGETSGRRRKYHSGIHSRSGSFYAVVGEGSAAIPTLFGLVEENEQRAERPVVEEVSARKSGPAEILMQYPTDLIDLVLSAPRCRRNCLAHQEIREEEKAGRFDASRQDSARNSPNVYRP